MKYLLLSLSLLILSLTACKKDNTSAGGRLPDASSSGKNFLACKVNGKVQVYSGKGEYMSPDGVGFGDYQDYMSVSGSGVVDYKDILGMRLNKDSTQKIQVGVNYFFDNEDGQHVAVYYSYPPGITTLKYTTSTRSGWVRFSRLDSVASGTFEFTAYYDQLSPDRTEPDTVRITEDRFDISRK